MATTSHHILLLVCNIFIILHSKKPDYYEKEKTIYSIIVGDYSSLTLSLNDQMMNLDLPVTVIYQGKTLFKGNVKRHSATWTPKGGFSAP